MKKERLAALMMAGIMSVSCAGIAMAATGTKTATLNNAKVRFNNGAVQTIQCYNIDGSNYVRARDITNNVDMDIQPLQGESEKGVMVISQRSKFAKYPDRVTPSKLTKQSAVVKVMNGKIYYDGWPCDVECFLLDGSYFFKATDFEKAAEKNLGVVKDTVAFAANPDNMYGKKQTNQYEYSISVDWNADEKVMEINRTSTDVWKMFDEIRGVDTKAAVVETPKAKPPVVATGVLTSAPEVGEVLANILIDEDEGAYTADGIQNWDNMTIPYTGGNLGQCTWYAKGRLIETHNLDISKNSFTGAATCAEWVENAKKPQYVDIDGTNNPKAIEAGCIAVWQKHVAFVEYVEYDSNGDPETVYFTEANAYHTGDMEEGKYYPDFDGKVQKMSLEKFTNGRSSAFVGYVIVK